MLFAVTDIETTGGCAAANGITEICIIITDGRQELNRYHTLLHPGCTIPPFVESLTGISNEMVAGERRFEAVASEIIELLQDKIFVAHNVNFDYSFLKHHLCQSGHTLTHKKLCTIRLGRKIVPGLRGYGLEKICAHLHIPLEGRHRASGDAAATVQLLHYLLERDTSGHVETMLKNSSREQYLPPNLPAKQIEKLPESCGVYFFYDKKGKIIYVGKARNIRKRVSSHFSNNNPGPRKQDLLKRIYSIKCQPTGNELMALIREHLEIRQHWPEYNRSQKRYELEYGIYLFADQSGYDRLVVERKKRQLPPITTFQQLGEAKSYLTHLVRKYELCPRLCFLAAMDVECSGNNLFHCHGACTGDESPENYNARLQHCLEELQKELPSFVLVCEGLSSDNKSCILMENGRFTGMGYVAAAKCIDPDPAVLKTMIQPFHHSEYIRNMMLNHANQHPVDVHYFRESNVATW